MEKIKPEKAAAMLRKEGMDITVEQAGQVLELLRKLADMLVSQYLESREQDEYHKENETK